jgi:hypothetical protein
MLTPILARVDVELASIRAGCPPGTLGRRDAIRRFGAFARTLAVDLASDVDEWQERTLDRYPKLEHAISWGAIVPAALCEGLERGAVGHALMILRRWAPAVASAVMTPISEPEMAVVATATQRVRDLADALESGVHDDPDVGPARVALPQVLFAIAEGADAIPHPSVYVPPVTEYCEALFWHALPDDNDLWGEPEIEDAVVEGIRPAAVVTLWHYRRGSLRRLAGAVNHRLKVRRLATDTAFHVPVGTL